MCLQQTMALLPAEEELKVETSHVVVLRRPWVAVARTAVLSPSMVDQQTAVAGTVVLVVMVVTPEAGADEAGAEAGADSEALV